MNINRQLPEKYYLQNFEYLIDFIIEKYSHILNQQELFFINQFKNLDEDSKCLFVRLINRRKKYFRTEDISYSEIQDCSSAINDLLDQKFLSVISETTEDILTIFTKLELIEFAKETNIYSASLSKQPKNELVQDLATNKYLIQHVTARHQIIKTNFENEINFIKFLFFGNLDGDMSMFVIRDIGNASFESVEKEELKPQFSSRNEAIQKYNSQVKYAEFRIIRETLEAIELYNWVKNHDFINQEYEDSIQSIYDKLLKKTALILEKADLNAEALEIYSYCKNDLCRERVLSVYKRLKENINARRIALEIITNPHNQEELIAAQDYIDRLADIKVKKTTRVLKSSLSIEVSMEYLNQVEQGAIYYYETQGYQGFHTENYIWNALFGLTFWEIIFDKSKLTHFQIRPENLYSKNFYYSKNKLINEFLTKIKTKSDLEERIQNTFINKYGILNPFVGWSENALTLVLNLIQYIDLDKIKNVLIEMMKDLKNNTRGFPDLFIFNKDSYKFVEVKSPNDHLSNQQVFWLNFLKDSGINVEVNRVNFI